MKEYQKPEMELVILVAQEAITDDVDMGDTSNPFQS